MNNSKFNDELYQEMLEEEPLEYQDDIQSDMFTNMMCDYL